MKAAHTAKVKIPDGRAGAQALKERLPAIFAKLIQTNIPALKASATARIAASHETLRRLGASPLPTTRAPTGGAGVGDGRLCRSAKSPWREGPTVFF